MASQSWIRALGPYHVASGTAATAAALADISPQPNVPLRAFSMQQGSRLEFQAWGAFSSTATPGTVVMGIYIGPYATAIASGMAAIVTAALTVKASQTNVVWRLEGNASIRTVGAGTAATLIGACEISNITSNGTDLAPATSTGGTFAFDSTVNNAIRLGVTPSVATGSWTCHYFGVRSVAWEE